MQKLKVNSMKQSQLLTKARKDVSQQEASINAQLLERAGYVSKLMAGVYSYLPLGLRVLAKIENIVRESMNSLAAQEILDACIATTRSMGCNGSLG